MKRLVDIVVSSVALVVLLPVLLVIVIAIKIESKGPVLYGAYRAGQGYRLFKLLKFRTMYTGADKQVNSLQHLNAYAAPEETTQTNECDCQDDCTHFITADGSIVCEEVIRKKSQSKAAFFKIKNDPRITRVGSFLRNTSLDEIPQLINVLRGDMSLVGNRPLPLYEAEQLTTDEAALRFMAPAGITGLWQVTKRGRKGEMTDEERIALDKDYAVNHSFGRDLKLIAKTFPALLQKENV